MKKFQNQNQNASVIFCETSDKNKKSLLSDLYTPEDLEQMFADDPPKINSQRKKSRNKSHQVLKCFTQINNNFKKKNKNKKNQKNKKIISMQ